MHIMESAPGARTVIDGREVDYFCGCGYYGFQGRAELLAAACEATSRYGLGSATSRQGLGNNPVLLDVEQKAATFFGTENALYYASGYMGNSILLQGLSDDYDMVFIDKNSHYSIYDAAALSGKPVVSFAHLDAEDLAAQLRKHRKPKQVPLVMSDGVFAVSGKIAPIPAYMDVLESCGSFFICVDDAHATGVLGKNGRGCFDYHELTDKRLFSTGTLSKALGGYGGIIAGSSAFRNQLMTLSKMTIASSAPPTPVAAATAKALEILSDHPELRTKLWENVAHAKKGLRAIGFTVDETPVPIICLSSKEFSLEKLPEALLSRDIAISRWYAGDQSYAGVPPHGAVRIAIFATHSKEQIDRLVGEIRALV